MHSWWIGPFVIIFIIMFSVVLSFVIKPIWSDIKIATHFFKNKIMISWYVSPIYVQKLYISLDLNWVFYKQLTVFHCSICFLYHHLSLLQGDFPNPEIEPSLPHCRWIPYQLSHKGSPKILECVDYPFSRGSSQPRKQSTVLALQEDSLPTELWGKPSQSVRLGLISTDSFDFHSSEDVCISFHSWRIFL